jgi:uncharacterized metal-binding protein
MLAAYPIDATIEMEWNAPHLGGCDSDSMHSSDDAIGVLIEGVNIAASSSSSTLSLALPASTLSVGRIKHAVAVRLDLDESEFHLLCQAQLFRDDHLHTSSAASSPLVLRLLPRFGLLGGKGGFGSLLRTATTKVGTKKTSNFSASRDLSGRRMRHVEAEQKIAEWNATHHDPINQQGRETRSAERCDGCQSRCGHSSQRALSLFPCLSRRVCQS